jgi:hypothetical protein
MQYKIWMDNFITEETNCYIAWDETQAGELGKYPTHEEAVQALLSYAAQL